MTLQLFDRAPIRLDRVGTADIWTRHAGPIWEAGDVGEIDSFYPVYRWGDFFSYAVLPLLAKKGRIDLNEAFFAGGFDGPGSRAGTRHTIDREIERLGGPPLLTRGIRRRDEAVARIAAAMQADIADGVDANPGCTHFVLCGGKDSLNILLADWRVPVVALSAAPNTPLVAEFIARNGLDIPLRELEDPRPASLDREIAENACQNDLEHWKWTEHLRRIAEENGHAAVFWKGQAADLFLTDYWKGFTNRRSRAYRLSRKLYKRASRLAPGLVDPVALPHVLGDMRRAIWDRVAIGQGAHLGFLRSICDCLFLSAYHGPRTAAVLYDLDFPSVTRRDLRPEVGAALLGREVWYPASNPAPPVSTFRKGLRDRAHTLAALDAMGIATDGA